MLYKDLPMWKTMAFLCVWLNYRKQINYPWCTIECKLYTVHNQFKIPPTESSRKGKQDRHLGAIVGMALLTRSLPEMSCETHVFLNIDDEDDGDTVVTESSVTKDSAVLGSDSGIISHMLSSSLTTSFIQGRLSLTSWQHLRARSTNFSTHSEG